MGLIDESTCQAPSVAQAAAALRISQRIDRFMKEANELAKTIEKASRRLKDLTEEWEKLNAQEHPAVISEKEA